MAVWNRQSGVHRMRPTHHQQVLPKNLVAANGKQKRQIEVSSVVVESAAMDAAGVYARLATCSTRLTTEETARRLAKHGPNVLSKDRRASMGKLLWNAVVNPLVILLLVLTAVSFVTGDVRAGVVMSLMIVMGSGLKLIQEARADSAAANSHGRSGSRAIRETSPVGYQTVDTIYCFHRPVFVDLRLHDFLNNVVLLRLLERFDARNIRP